MPLADFFLSSAEPGQTNTDHIKDRDTTSKNECIKDRWPKTNKSKKARNRALHRSTPHMSSRIASPLNQHPDEWSKAYQAAHPCTNQQSRESFERSQELYLEEVDPLSQQSLCSRSSSRPQGSPLLLGLGLTPLMCFQSRLYQV